MKKLRRKNGFTLIEMLIVVAIVAILIAVSIPLVGSALDRAREATDAANERAFKAALITSYLQGEAGMGPKIELGKPYCYDAAAGTFILNKATGNPYGQAKVGTDPTASDHRGCYLWGYIGQKDPVTGNVDNSVYMGWASNKEMNDLSKIEPGTLTSWYLQ